MILSPPTLEFSSAAWLPLHTPHDTHTLEYSRGHYRVQLCHLSRYSSAVRKQGQDGRWFASRPPPFPTSAPQYRSTVPSVFVLHAVSLQRRTEHGRNDAIPKSGAFRAAVQDSGGAGAPFGGGGSRRVVADVGGIARSWYPLELSEAGQILALDDVPTQPRSKPCRSRVRVRIGGDTVTTPRRRPTRLLDVTDAAWERTWQSHEGLVPSSQPSPRDDRE